MLRVLCLYPYMRVSTFQCFSLSHLCTNIVSSPKFSACSVTGVASYFFSWKNEMSTFVALCFYLSWSCLAGACVSGHRVCLSIKFETGVSPALRHRPVCRPRRGATGVPLPLVVR